MQAARTLFQSMLWRGLYYVTAFIINVLIARHFQASVSGFIYYISSIYALVLLLSSLSIESGIIYFAAKGEIAVGKLYNFTIAWSLIIGLISFFTVYLFFGDSYAGMSKTLLIVSSVSFIFGNLLAAYCSGFFYARQNFIVPNCINITCTVILIVLIPYHGKSIIPAITNQNYFYIYFCSFFVQGICMAIAVKIKYIQNGAERFLSIPEFKILFRYCALAFTGNIIYFLLYRVDYFFVEKYCSDAQLGNYIQVSKLGHLFFILPTILASAIFSITAAGQKTDIIDILSLLSRIIFSVYLVACIFLMITGKWFFPFVFGESFSGMYQPFLLLVPGILSLSGLFTLTAYFAGKNRMNINITGSVYALAIILVGDIIFIPRYGINAAALISSIAYIIYQGYIVFVFKKEFNAPLSHFYILKSSDWQKINKRIRNLIKKTSEP